MRRRYEERVLILRLPGVASNTMDFATHDMRSSCRISAARRRIRCTMLSGASVPRVRMAQFCRANVPVQAKSVRCQLVARGSTPGHICKMQLSVEVSFPARYVRRQRYLKAARCR
jgi:hypothetical protein